MVVEEKLGKVSPSPAQLPAETGAFCPLARGRCDECARAGTRPARQDLCSTDCTAPSLLPAPGRNERSLNNRLRAWSQDADLISSSSDALPRQLARNASHQKLSVHSGNVYVRSHLCVALGRVSDQSNAMQYPCQLCFPADGSRVTARGAKVWPVENRISREADSVCLSQDVLSELSSPGSGAMPTSKEGMLQSLEDLGLEAASKDPPHVALAHALLVVSRGLEMSSAGNARNAVGGTHL